MKLFVVCLTAAALVGSHAQVVETLEDFETMGRRFAEYAQGAAPSDAETLRNVLAAGSEAGAALGNGCPGAGCSSFIQKPQATAEVRVTGAKSSEEADRLRNGVKINVAKTEDIPQELLAFVSQYEQKRNDQERSLLESALHSAPKRTNFLARSASEPAFDIKIGGSQRFPDFYSAVREMEAHRDAAEENLRQELVSLLNRPSVSLLARQNGSAKALAETIATLQRRAFDDAAFGAQVMDQINSAGQHAALLRKNIPEFNVKYEFPVSEGSSKANAELTATLKNLQKEHSSFLMNGGQFDRRTQAPMVWLHLNDGHATFAQVPQAITPSIDLYVEQGPASSQ